MKFDAQYSQLKPHCARFITTSSKTNGTIMKAENLAPCGICGQPTAFIDVGYETRVCSTECMDALAAALSDLWTWRTIT